MGAPCRFALSKCRLNSPGPHLFPALLFLLLSAAGWLMPASANAQYELGSEDDLTVLGVSATAEDPDVEIKGFTVFGSTQTSYTGAVVGPGHVVVNGVLAVSSGAYFVGNSTFTGAGKIFINDGSAGQLLRRNAAGYLEWNDATAVGDNLGNHVATTTLNMASWNMVGISSVNFRSNVFVTSATAAQQGGVYISTHAYIAGQVQITGGTPGAGKVLISDANGLASWSSAGAIGDNLGDHTATTTLQMGAYGVNTSSNITAAAYQIKGSTVLAILPGVETIAVGPNTGRVNTGNYSVFVGSGAGAANTTGAQNTFTGHSAGYSNTTGAQNTFAGYAAGFSNATGWYNTFLGVNAGYYNTAGQYNSFVGNGAGLRNTTGSNNSILGYYSGYYNRTGSGNLITGHYAGGYGAGADNSFSSSTVMGYQAGYSLTTGSDNTFLGWQAGYNVTTGTGNIIIGYDQRTPLDTTSNFLNIGSLLYGDISAKTIGISTRVPQAALDIVSTGTASNIYAQIWRDGGGVTVASMTSEGKLFADGSALTGIAGGVPASIDVSTINATGTTPYGGVNITTNTFVSGRLGVGTTGPLAALEVRSYSEGNYTAMLSTSSVAGVYSVAVSSAGVTNINNLVIENRTSDPETPLTGQIWLRVD